MFIEHERNRNKNHTGTNEIEYKEREHTTTREKKKTHKPPHVIEDPGSSIVSEHKNFLEGSSIMS